MNIKKELEELKLSQILNFNDIEPLIELNLFVKLKSQVTEYLEKKIEFFESIKDSVNPLEKRIALGGKLRGYKEILDYLNTH